MLMVLHNLLPPDVLKQVTDTLATATFTDGKVSAGMYAKTVKNNLQTTANTPEGKAAGEMVVKALMNNWDFTAGVRPKVVLFPLFNRYETGMAYGDHLDNAVMVGKPTIRNDVAMTLFLNEPSEYDGGELVVHSDLGERSFKLNAGEAIVYPATFLHRVQPVTRGHRLVAVTWIQSMVRDPAQRQILYELAAATVRLSAGVPDRLEFQILRKCRDNLMRMWVDV